MRNIAKFATAAALVGAMAIATTPSQAEHGRNAAAAIGFGAGALVGAAAASQAADRADGHVVIAAHLAGQSHARQTAGGEDVDEFGGVARKP